MASNFAFSPYGLTFPATVTAGTATLTLTSGGPSLTTGQFIPDGMRIANIGTAGAFIQLGVTAPTVALATGMPILPNTVEVFQLKGQVAMAFTSAGTTTLFITRGEGV